MSAVQHVSVVDFTQLEVCYVLLTGPLFTKHNILPNDQHTHRIAVLDIDW